MIIKSIKLINFRNHSQYYLECKDETSLILGENGSGKTSVLEAIYILTRGKSFRATDQEIIKNGTSYYRIELEYTNGEKCIATFDNKNKTFLFLDKKTRRLPKKNKYPVVLFLPSDLNLISNSPSRRRDYFDFLFSQFNEIYNNNLLKYNKALKQRNELLKRENIKKEDIFSWNILLAKYGTEISLKRKQYIEEINSKITKTYHTIKKNHDKIEIIYKTDVVQDESKYLKKLEENSQKDLILGHTSFGIHRDDYVFMFNNKIADGSASRGETRSIILSLKFIESEMLFEKLKKPPLILLDDVFSELDETRKRSLVENFKNHQVIITSVEDVN